MKIILTSECEIKLATACAAAWGMEMSGFGFCTREGNQITIYDFVLLDVGSSGFTEIPTGKLLEIMQRKDHKNMKVWGHVHPLGSGIPGPHNWSGTDNHTIQHEPLGGIPELVKWSVSVVLTPRGWVGRVDNHLSGKTIHCEVEYAGRETFEAALAIKDHRRTGDHPYSFPHGQRYTYQGEMEELETAGQVAAMFPDLNIDVNQHTARDIIELWTDGAFDIFQELSTYWEIADAFSDLIQFYPEAASWITI